MHCYNSGRIGILGKFGSICHLFHYYYYFFFFFFCLSNILSSVQFHVPLPEWPTGNEEYKNSGAGRRLELVHESARPPPPPPPPHFRAERGFKGLLGGGTFGLHNGLEGQSIVHTQWVPPPPPPNSIVNMNVPRRPLKGLDGGARAS